MHKNQYGQTKLTTLYVLIFCALAAFSTGIYLFYQQHDQRKNLSQLNGTFLQMPRAINQFKLIDHQNNVFTNENLLNHWSMLFFGFTNCPHMCPTTMATLEQMYEKLQQAQVTPLPQVVMVTVDPERDTTTALNRFVTAFNTDFIGVTGSQTMLDQLSKQLGIAYMKISNDDADNYDVEHSGAIILFNPEGKLAGFFSLPHDGLTLAKDMQLVLS